MNPNQNARRATDVAMNERKVIFFILAVFIERELKLTISRGDARGRQPPDGGALTIERRFGHGLRFSVVSRRGSSNGQECCSESPQLVGQAA
jgi:hypothetical protein